MSFIQIKKLSSDVWEATAHFDEACVVGDKKYWLFKAEGLDELDAVQNVKEYCRKKGAVLGPEPIQVMES